MQILVEIKNYDTSKAIKAYAAAYEKMVLGSKRDTIDSDFTIYIVESISCENRIDNTILYGFNVAGYRSLINCDDGVVLFYHLHALIQARFDLQEAILFKNGRSVMIDEIFSIEAFNRKTLVVVDNKTFTSEHSYKYWCDALKFRSFIEVHRGVLVNLNYVDSWTSDVVYMKNTNTYPLARRKKSKLIALMLALHLKNET